MDGLLGQRCTHGTRSHEIDQILTGHLEVSELEVRSDLHVVRVGTHPLSAHLEERFQRRRTSHRDLVQRRSLCADTGLQSGAAFGVVTAGVDQLARASLRTLAIILECLALLGQAL